MRIAIPFASIGLLNSDNGVFPEHIRNFLMTAFTLVVQLSLVNLSIVSLMMNKLIYGIAIAGGISYIFYKITGKTIIATLVVIGAIAVSVISLIKENNNFSMVDTIKNIVKYELMQKEYKFERK